MGRGAGSEARRDGPAEASKEQDEAVEVLREVWSASGQTSTELDDLFGTARSCKNMQAVGFDALAAEGGDLRGAWRATLEREGKLSTEQGSIRDLVLGSAEPGDR
jgi:hypothetical protein